jgi:hydroxymethylbilane synthase
VHPGTGDLDAVVLARAGLARIGRLDAVAEAFEPGVMLPAPGQGALAVEVRGLGAEPGPLDVALHKALDALADRETTLSVTAERAFLARLEAGCAAPLGALAHLETTPSSADQDGAAFAETGGEGFEELVLEAVAVTVDGRTAERRTARLQAAGGDDGITLDDATRLGTQLADEIAAAMPDVVGTGR